MARIQNKRQVMMLSSMAQDKKQKSLGPAQECMVSCTHVEVAVVDWEAVGSLHGKTHKQADEE